MQSQLLFWDQLRKLELASRQMMDKGSLSLQQKTTSYKKTLLWEDLYLGMRWDERYHHASSPTPISPEDEYHRFLAVDLGKHSRKGGHS